MVVWAVGGVWDCMVVYGVGGCMGFFWGYVGCRGIYGNVCECMGV